MYYTTKLETVRKQSYYPRVFAFELIMNDANTEYLKRNFDRACRKYEEAYATLRYFYSTNPKWSEQGIDDDELKEINFVGTKPWQAESLKKMKLSALLNIAACCIKTKDFEGAVDSSKEALLLDPKNTKALYRRSRALSLPINSGVEEFQEAITYLKQINETEPGLPHVERDIKKLQSLVKINRKREHETYGNMFKKRTGSGKDEKEESVQEYIEKKQKVIRGADNQHIDPEFEEEKRKMDLKVK